MVAAVDSWQRRHPVGGLPIAVGKLFGEDRASSLAVLIASTAATGLAVGIAPSAERRVGFAAAGARELRR
jgi:hypothetical protein